MTTEWAKMFASVESARYLRDTHALWTRLEGGERIFTALPIGTEPQANDGGYFSIAAALHMKGLAR